MPLTVEQFTERIISSGVLPNEQLSELLAGLPADAKARSDAEALARELVKQKKLTKFQAEQIYAGKGASLSLGNYLVLDKLGEGGMGMVLKAWHRRMERTVALKVINPKVLKEQSALKRFQREVIAAAKLTHPNIVAAYDADEAKGTHFLVMEYVEGSDLSSWVKEHGPLPVEQAVSCIIQAARGLAFAHDKGVVHRDIKPHNLLLARSDRARSDRIYAVGQDRPDESGHYERDVVKILDMGLARIEGGFGGSAEHADLTRSGAMMGTVDYMAPEQAMDSKHADARSDIYSLGCTLFYLVTGHVAFEADTVMKRLTAHQSAPPPSLAEQLRVQSSEPKSGLSAVALDSGLATLDAVFQRMVAKKPDDRPQSMLQVIAELERCLTSGSATVSVASGSNPVAKPSAPAKVPANVSSRDADTIVESSSDSKTNGLGDVTVVLDSSVVKNPADGTTTSSIKSRKMILISAATIVVLLLAIFFATRGGSDKSADNSKDQSTLVAEQSKAKTSITEDTNSEPAMPAAVSGKLFLHDPAFPQWIKDVQAMSVGEQVMAVSKKLKELNRGFDGKLTDQGTKSPRIENGVVTQLGFQSEWVHDLSPIRAFDGLTSLSFGAGRGRGKVDDLSPLSGLKLTHLACNGNPVTDLSPLKGMPLTILECNSCGKISNLAPLAGMSLTKLDVAGAPMIANLAPLMGMKLTDLRIGSPSSQLSDLSSLRGMPLEFLLCSGPNVSDISPLAECSSLKQLKLQGTGVTAAGVAELQKALPGCKIDWDGPAKVISPQPAAGSPSFAKAPFDSKQARAHQEAWAKHLGTVVETANSIGMKMVLVPPGEFLMGSSDVQIEEAVKDVVEIHGQEFANRLRITEKPQHRVTLTKPFWMSATEVTIGQFRKFVEATKHQTYAEKQVKDEKSWTYLRPGYAVTDESPVAAVTWDDAVAYCRWLSQKENAAYRLPTEAEWEYACRAGTDTVYSCGDRLLDTHAWSIQNSEVKARQVGTKQPNPFGLFDMHGNLSEWCQDRFDEKWYAQSPTTDPIGPATGATYVLRGGNWDYNSILRSAYRVGQTEGVFHYSIGFRVVREVGGAASATPAKPTLPVDGDRLAATWVIEHGGHVWLKHSNTKFDKVADLPAGKIEVRAIDLKTGLQGADADLTALHGLKDIEFFVLDSTYATPAALAGLERSGANRLSFGGVVVTDAHLAAIVRWPQLTRLFMAGGRLTSQHCRTIATMTKLTALNLTSNPLIDDSGVEALGQLRELVIVQLNGTGVTAAGIAKLRQALPACEIQWDGAPSPPTVSNLMPENRINFYLGGSPINFSRDGLGVVIDHMGPGAPPPLFTAQGWKPEETVLRTRLREFAASPNDSEVWVGFYSDNEAGRIYARLHSQGAERKWILTHHPNWRDDATRITLAEASASEATDGIRELELRYVGDKLELFENGKSIVSAANIKVTLGSPVIGLLRSKWRLERWTAERPESSVAWTDWLGPKLKPGKFVSHFAAGQGWQQEEDAITTTSTISGQEVMRGKTRDGAVRLTYLLRDSKGIQINACDRSVNKTRELYVAEDHGAQISLTLIRGGTLKVLVKEPIPASIPKDAQRTLEFRIAGDTLTATFNGSVVATVKDTTLTEGNFALVALKGILVQKVEYQKLDEPIPNQNR